MAVGLTGEGSREGTGELAADGVRLGNVFFVCWCEEAAKFDDSRVGLGVVDLDGLVLEDAETDEVSIEAESGVWAGLAVVDVDATGALSCEDMMTYGKRKACLVGGGIEAGSKVRPSNDGAASLQRRRETGPRVTLARASQLSWCHYLLVSSIYFSSRMVVVVVVWRVSVERRQVDGASIPYSGFTRSRSRSRQQPTDLVLELVRGRTMGICWRSGAEPAKGVRCRCGCGSRLLVSCNFAWPTLCAWLTFQRMGEARRVEVDDVSVYNWNWKHLTIPSFI